MGLDQYGYVKVSEEADVPSEMTFYWRKHARLQAWAEALFVAKTGQGAEALNCAELVLTVADIAGLRALVTDGALPKSNGGFFYGHQFQDEQVEAYAAQDLAFCDWAEVQIASGETVVYSCWW
ncbi:hypothetical protein [Cognatishimia sp. MH4019]|uniref:hypothetical protein n=1 Tax=Cognatishimia sp. MH4019 TaxID=2854030 RepID=UPI001CD3AE5C|nr:hypothetical protein [Cognatishimia sp. MH4019]